MSKKYHLIEGKNAKGTIIMTDDLSKVKARKKAMEVSTRTSRYNSKKREFLIIEAEEGSVDYARKAKSKWQNYNKSGPEIG